MYMIICLDKLPKHFPNIYAFYGKAQTMLAPHYILFSTRFYRCRIGLDGTTLYLKVVMDTTELTQTYGNELKAKKFEVVMFTTVNLPMYMGNNLSLSHPH